MTLSERMTALEGIELDPEGDLETLVAQLQERQKLLDGVQMADVEALPEPLKEQIKGRLRGLLSHTQTAVRALEARRAALAGKQEQVVTARQAARGYRPDLQQEGVKINRRA